MLKKQKVTSGHAQTMKFKPLMTPTSQQQDEL